MTESSWFPDPRIAEYEDRIKLATPISSAEHHVSVLTTSCKHCRRQPNEHARIAGQMKCLYDVTWYEAYGTEAAEHLRFIYLDSMGLGDYTHDHDR